MNYIEKMLAGEIKMIDFITILKKEISLQNQLKHLIPCDAVNNPAHELWKNISYDSLKKNRFDFLKFLGWICRMDGTIGDNLNLFDSIYTVYVFCHPNINCTNEYENIYELYLDVVGDCFDGPEVSLLIEQIIRDAFRENTKKRRILHAKKSIYECFHYENKKRPLWVHGAEWPMGCSSPMKFLFQKRNGEFVEFWFSDVDTGETKIIKQYY